MSNNNPKNDLFPFVACHADQALIPPKLRSAWLKVKPERLTWYGLHVIVHSQTEVEFVTYEMLSMVHGGIGEEKYRVKTVVDPEVLRQAILYRALALGEVRLRLEEEDRRRREVARHAEQILCEFAPDLAPEIHL